MKKNRVVITGIGPVNQIGIGKDDFINGILHPKKNILKKIPNKIRILHDLKTKYYVPATKINESSNKRMNMLGENNSKIASLAANLAIKDSGLKIKEENDVGTILGVGIADYAEIFDNYNKYKNTNRINKIIAPKSMPNAPSSWIAINNKLHGENYVINAACASGTYSIGEGYRKIADGYSKALVCGGLEWLKEDSMIVLKSFESLGVIDKSDDGIPKPFQKDRSGFLFNEGSACCIVMENYEQALKRGANIYAEIESYEATMDAYSVLAIDKRGTEIKKMLNNLIGNKKIDYYNAHGTGTKLNDYVESNVMRDLFGNNQPLTNSTKGLLGHTFGASGAIEAVMCCLAIKYGIVHKNISTKTIDGINLAKHTVDNLNINSAVSSSFGFGGHNGSLLFKKVR